MFRPNHKAQTVHRTNTFKNIKIHNIFHSPSKYLGVITKESKCHCGILQTESYNQTNWVQYCMEKTLVSFAIAITPLSANNH